MDIILEKKQQGKNTIEEEKEIDRQIYAIYKLTPKEIDLIEKDIKL